MQFDPIMPQVFDITVNGGRLDTRLSIAPETHKVELAAKKLGVDVNVTPRSDGSMSFSSNDLSWDMVLETKLFGLVSLAEAVKFVAQQPNEKLRIQAPSRASYSFAAFLSFNAEGKPFIHDTGTGSTHWLKNDDDISSQVTSIPDFIYADLSNLKTNPAPLLSLIHI